ncbi:interferon-induced, double-stranded RNA-activated kinase [Paramuricea clavata]|nr:interferon-induced, double-stranded RNA-activated kinase [Paramuricea clavata]
MDTTDNEEALYAEFEKALSKDYQIDGRLGKGAYGQVFKAKCRKDGKTYAIKMLTANNDRYQTRELEALIKLNLLEESKRNFIEYFKAWFLEVGNVQKLCIQMELCWGDLKSFVFKNRQFGPQVTQAQDPQFYQHVFQQILNGLVVIHSIGWVHRDIHPGNILIVNSNPQRISDIHVKIGDFGLARCIGYKGIQFNVSCGKTLHPQLEQCTPAREGDSIYSAPELFTTTYDEKVDLYSAGAVLYFISRYPEENENKWITELKNLIQGKVDINESLVYKDDKKLCSLIKDLRRRNPNERPSASDAKKYMFPEAKDSTDGKKAQKIKFFARKENEDLRTCSLGEFTFSALKAEVERRTRVKASQLRQEDMINCEKMRIVIDDDEDVEKIFENAAQKAQEGRYVVVVVTEKAEEYNTETRQISSGDIMMQSPPDTV